MGLSEDSTKLNPKPSADAPFTRNLGRYTLLKRLAVGGMAEIFLARQQGMAGFEKILVVKKILESFASDESFVNLFLDEARTAAQLNHPNIVQIFDLGQTDGAYYIAMEYLAGESVSRLVRRSMELHRRLPMHLVAQIVAQAADGLHFAHTATDTSGKPLGIVHRDVSPQNLVVTYTGGVKVVDFGIALSANRVSHTDQGQVRGKLAYMSPEQAKGDEVDARVDVFALGVVLFEALTSTRLFPDTPVKIFAELLGPRPLPRASSRSAEVPFRLDEIVATALRKNLGERYQTAKELHDDLQAWLRETDLDRSQSLADLMGDLFGVERDLRTRMIDQALKGEEISSGVAERLSSNPSMPGVAVTGVAEVKPRQRPTKWLAGGLVGAVGLAGAGFALWPAHSPVRAEIAVAPISVNVTGVPATAHVIVDGVDRGPSPVQLTDLKLGFHVATLRLAGSPDVNQTFQLEHPGQVENLKLEMPSVHPTPPPAAPTPAPPAPPPAPAKAAQVTPPPVASQPPPRRPTPTASAAEKGPKAAHHFVSEGGMGDLDIDSAPWAAVTIDGKPAGETPLLGLKLASGRHLVVLTATEQHVTKSISVEITGGKTTTERVKF